MVLENFLAKFKLEANLHLMNDSLLEYFYKEFFVHDQANIISGI